MLTSINLARRVHIGPSRFGVPIAVPEVDYVTSQRETN